MKKKFILHLVFFVQFFTFSSSYVFAQQQNCGPAGNEAAIKYGKNEDYLYTAELLKRYKDSFSNNFFNKDSKKLEITEDFVTIKALEGVMKIFTPATKYDASNCHAAIEFIYGMQKDKLILIYHPIFLSPLNKDEFEIKSIDTFLVSGMAGELKGINTKDKDDAVKLYRDPEKGEVIIHHPWKKTRDKNRFIDNDGDWRYGDTKSCYIPIKQIMEMYLDNKANHECTGTDEIHFSLVASNYFKTGWLGHTYIKNFKLHVIASYNIGVMPYDDNRYTRYGVDFAQMCPPRCNQSEVETNIPLKRKDKHSLK